MLKITKPNPCWVLGYPRTGSSLLCEILNKSGLFRPPFLEWFNYAKGETFSDIPWAKHKTIKCHQDLLQKLPCYLKIHRNQFNRFFRDKDKPNILQSLPNLRFILLRRRNLVSATASYYIAKFTNIYWLDNMKDAEQFRSIPIEIDSTQLAIDYSDMIWLDKSWNNFVSGTNCLNLFYEDLVKNLFDTAKQIFDFLELKTDIKAILPLLVSTKSQHPQTTEIEDAIRRVI